MVSDSNGEVSGNLVPQELKRSAVTVIEILGLVSEINYSGAYFLRKGNFGEVCKGTYDDGSGRPAYLVAIKTLKEVIG